jgi:glutamate racemase
MTIGICDYGIGGISLYKRLRAETDVDVLYYSDAGYVPYGKVPEAELRSQVQNVLDFLFEQGADCVAVACNAASTVLPQDDRIIGIIEYGLQVVREANVRKVGVVGGFRTVESNLYKTPLEREGMTVLQNPAQVLSIRVEAGDVHSDGLLSDIRTIFDPLSDCDSVLLACTHYPVIAGQIRSVVPGIVLLDPMEHMVASVHDRFGPLKGGNTIRWMTSGDTENMRQAARKAFGLQLTNIEQIIV